MAEVAEPEVLSREPDSLLLRLEQKLQQVVLDVVDHGAGPLVGSAAYGDARLADTGDRNAASRTSRL